MADFLVDDEIRRWQKKAAEFAQSGLRPRAAGWGRPAGRHVRDALMCYHIDGLNGITRMKLGAMLAGEAHAGAI